MPGSVICTYSVKLAVEDIPSLYIALCSGVPGILESETTLRRRNQFGQRALQNALMIVKRNITTPIESATRFPVKPLFVHLFRVQEGSHMRSASKVNRPGVYTC